MVRSCQAFLNKHEDLLEEALVRKFHHKMGVWLCHEVSDSCSGVVRLNANTPEDNQVSLISSLYILRGRLFLTVKFFNPDFFVFL